MGVLVPVIHAIQHAVRLVNHQYRRLAQDVELAVSGNHRHFDDAVGFRVQPGHFHVEPDEVVLILCHTVQSLRVRVFSFIAALAANPPA
jgi:hypothetical protein